MNADLISVCICTYKRPEMLKRALRQIIGQKTEHRFLFEVIIVDNDRSRSAEAVVNAVQEESDVRIDYDCEPVQNISLARNRCVRNSTGNFIAFIDDDEVPNQDWLLRLFSCCREYEKDGVLGPVKPLYIANTPAWLRKSGLCERPSHKTGTVLNYLETRTGNVLFKQAIINSVVAPFSPELGRTGGEDIEFFRVMMSRGFSFVWCEEAPVFEHISPERYQAAFYLDKYLRIGGLTGELLKDTDLEKWRTIYRSLCAILFYASTAGAGIIMGKHLFINRAVKIAYHLGRILGCFGFVPIKERWESRNAKQDAG